MTVMELSNGFETMEADELYFINGGSSSYNRPSSKPSSDSKPTTGQCIVYAAVYTGLSIAFIGNNSEPGVPEMKDAVAKHVAGMDKNK